VDAGWRQENAKNKEIERRSDSIRRALYDAGAVPVFSSNLMAEDA
jgi:hypothetical protein